MNITQICIFVGVFYVLVNAASGAILAKVVTHPKTNSFEKEKGEILNLGFNADLFYKITPREDFVCSSEDGYKIHYSIFKKDGSKKTVLLSHGYVGNRFSVLVYVEFLLNMGYNCIIFDQRNHGYNVKSFTTIGYLEEKDLRAVLKDSLIKLGNQEIIGLFGVSMGGATVLNAASKIEKLDFVIEDSAYSGEFDLIKSLMPRVVKYSLLLLIPFLGLFQKLFYGFFIWQVNPKKAVSKYREDLPVLFIHSKIDKKVPYKPSFDRLYNAKKGKKMAFVSENAKHAKMVFEEGDNYKKKIEEFLIFASGV